MNVQKPHRSTFLKQRQNIDAVKVNAYARCNSAVSEITLSVTVFDLTRKKIVAKTPAKKEQNSADVKNEDAWMECRGSEATSFKGAAMGTSYEGGKSYAQFANGMSETWACSQ